jgi:hypothetical protein
MNKKWKERKTESRSLLLVPSLKILLSEFYENEEIHWKYIFLEKKNYFRKIILEIEWVLPKSRKSLKRL